MKSILNMVIEDIMKIQVILFNVQISKFALAVAIQKFILTNFIVEFVQKNIKDPYAINAKMVMVK